MIKVSCECGFSKQVPDQWAGRRAKCRCGKTLLIPAAGDDSPAIAVGDVESSELPEQQNFFAAPVLATDQGWWLFETGVAVSANTQQVAWRLTDSHDDLPSKPRWFTCAGDRVLSIHPFAAKNRAWQLVVSQLPQAETR